MRAAAKKRKERPHIVTHWGCWMTRRARVTVHPRLSGGASGEAAFWDPLKAPGGDEDWLPWRRGTAGLRRRRETGTVFAGSLGNTSYSGLLPL